MRTVRIVSLFTLALFLFPGCQVSDGDEEPIDPGRELLADANIDMATSDLAWSVNSDTVFYSGPLGIRGVDVGTKGVRTILFDGSRISALSASFVDSKLYYLAVPFAGIFTSLKSVGTGGGSVNSIADSINAYAVSPDGGLIAVSGIFSHSLDLIDPATGTRTPVSTGTPVTFSPDNLQLIYYSPGSRTPAVRVLAGGAESALMTLTDSLMEFRRLRWGTTGVYGILRDTLIQAPEETYQRFRYVRIENGISEIYRTTYGTIDPFLGRNGLVMGYWTTDCIKREVGGLFDGNCVTTQYSIVAFSPGFTEGKEYVVHKSGYLQRGNVAVSPDETKIAYFAEGKMYLVRL